MCVDIIEGDGVLTVRRTSLPMGDVTARELGALDIVSTQYLAAETALRLKGAVISGGGQQKPKPTKTKTNKR